LTLRAIFVFLDKEIAYNLKTAGQILMHFNIIFVGKSNKSDRDHYE